MNERGQIFTLDMFFALTLTVLVVSYSGLALEQARRQTEDYALRYSIERTANDAADVLLKTMGRPSNWEENVENLETLGLASAPNRLSLKKLEELRSLCAWENWGNDPAKSDAEQAVRYLFGNSENFEIRLIDENTGEDMWQSIWPRWQSGTTSGAAASLEVVVVKRLVAITEIDIRDEIRGILRVPGPPHIYRLYFEVGSGELDTLDWYIVLRPSKPTQPVVKIWVNREAPEDDEENLDYHFPEMKPPKYGLGVPIYQPTYKIRWHKEDGVEAQNAEDFVPLHEGSNFIDIRVTGTGETVDIFLIVLPMCSPSGWTLLGEVGTLEVRLWR